MSVEVKTVGGDQVSNSQRRKSNDPNLLATQGLVTGNKKEVRRVSARVVKADDGRRMVGVEVDITGVFNRSSGTDSGQPLEVRDDEAEG